MSSYQRKEHGHKKSKPKRANSLHSLHSPHFSLGGGCPFMHGDDDDEAMKNDYETKQSQNGTQSAKRYDDCYYHEYLQLDKILTANAPRCSEYCQDPEAAHDEHLFITIHQAYELWFKQILFELDSCIVLLGGDILDDRELLKIVSRLQRIGKILKLLNEQFTILDTMTPMNFLDFRKYLKPASGFQSIQFRLLENKLGLLSKQRMRYNKQEYTKVLRPEHEDYVLSEQQKCKYSLFDAIEKWLERFPYLQSHDWSFWTQYKSAVNDYILEEKQLYANHVQMDGDNAEVKKRIETELDHAYQQHVATFNAIFDEKKYCQLQKEGKVRLSYTALQAALMIMLYREEPVLQMPFRVLELSMEVDNMLTQWRNAHALMVHRMLGSKMGTGGSSGFHYLRTAAVHHKVFTDFFNLSTYMIPKSNLPQLPNSLKFFMNFPATTNQMRRIPMQQRHKEKEKQQVSSSVYTFGKELPPYPTISSAKSVSPHQFSSTLNDLVHDDDTNKTQNGDGDGADDHDDDEDGDAMLLFP